MTEENRFSKTIFRSLVIYPNGIEDSFKSHISFYLRLEDFDSIKFKVSFRLGILGRTENEKYLVSEIHKTHEEIEESKGKDWGFPEFISHDNLFEEYKELIVDGHLKLFCDVSLRFP